MNVVGPLTAAFSAPASCTSSYSHSYLLNQTAKGLLWAQLGPLSTTDCFPDNYQSARSAFFSPGVCPDGFTTACLGLASGNPSLTTATCCPTISQFECNAGTGLAFMETLACISRITGSLTVLDTTIDIGPDGSYTTKGTTTRALPSGAFVNAFAVQVAFEKDDFASSSSTTSAASSQQTSASSAAPATSASSGGVLETSTASSSAASSSSSSGSDNSSSGLTAGASAGIAVGAIAGVGLIVLAAFMLWRRARKQRMNPSVELPNSPIGPGYPPGGPGNNGAWGAMGHPGQSPGSAPSVMDQHKGWGAYDYSQQQPQQYYQHQHQQQQYPMQNMAAASQGGYGYSPSDHGGAVKEYSHPAELRSTGSPPPAQELMSTKQHHELSG